MLPLPTASRHAMDKGRDWRMKRIVSHDLLSFIYSISILSGRQGCQPPSYKFGRPAVARVFCYPTIISINAAE
ncbi:hypothetical protein IAS59_006520 [Cryptococcus gattii]